MTRTSDCVRFVRVCPIQTSFSTAQVKPDRQDNPPIGVVCPVRFPVPDFCLISFIVKTKMQTIGCRRTLARFVDRLDWTGGDIAALTVARGRGSRRDGCEVGGWRGRGGRCRLIGCGRFRLWFRAWHGVEGLEPHCDQGAPGWTQRLVSGPAITPAAYRALAHSHEGGKLLLFKLARF